MDNLKAADAVWVATALLQEKAPEASFPVAEIVEKVQIEHLTSKPKPTIYLHANQHCVANRPPNDARLRMLIETDMGNRRLFHEGDQFHPLRAHARTTPKKEDLPPRYLPLLNWYKDWSASHAKSWEETDPILRLFGLGKGLWADEDPVEYVRHLREG
ncbi:MAG: hypothetical protein JSS87_07760 [Acidobacteria bacterium]|nr:hypothetical protein [Acidobacteriota bacterium]